MITRLPATVQMVHLPCVLQSMRPAGSSLWSMWGWLRATGLRAYLCEVSEGWSVTSRAKTFGWRAEAGDGFQDSYHLST